MRVTHQLVVMLTGAALLVGCSETLPETTTENTPPPGTIGAVTTVGLADVTSGGDVTAPADLDVGDVDDTEESDTGASDTGTSDTGASDTATAADTEGPVDTAPDAVEVDMGPPVYASCQAAFDAGDTASGVRAIDAGGEVHDAFCEQAREGGGWTLVAKLTVLGEQSGEGPWRVEADPNLWETDGLAELGTSDITVNEDYRSPLFHLLPASQIRITRNDTFVLDTTDCLGNRPLAQVFRDAGWNCTGGEGGGYAECALTCGIASVGDTNDGVFGDGALVVDALYLKAGESDTADPDYTDRTYVATNFIGVGMGFPHYVGGLGGGCFGANCSGSYDVAGRGDNPARPDENSVWAVYVR